MIEVCESGLNSYTEATPTRIRQYLFEEHNLTEEQIEKIMTDQGQEIRIACDKKFLTYKIGDQLVQLLNNGAA